MWRASRSTLAYGCSHARQPEAVAIRSSRPRSNAIQISDDVRTTMKELSRNFPPGLEYRIVYDPTVFVRGLDRAVVHTARSHRLVVLVVILFLQTWRASVIPLLAVRFDHGTFAVMYLFGFYQRAVAIRLGARHRIVVDDAIVVVENVQRGIEEGCRA